ncbi:hypothetical protein DSN97_05415 [Deferribacteraceae bacterium V6Fe1]|jgi:hypothetical protein|uniref:hypothetical protein n=1 Tax=Deferrivibrio essentukiensis TaxID=2880922 RepID=UPI001F617BCE|nr:hypothetical protein [Deferrivibrio essentukiensis]MBZ4672915.1 hypothetical protein [Deferribacteraceae bacterium]MCB4203888.1 hypothetical protein [Deferrivibrio essentukiensis]UOD35752.1 hypothetical protein DSN97_05415 [Deferribacteraceae bacterium V6Fe1]
MILALVKKTLLKEQLKNYFKEIKFYDSPLELVQEMHKFNKLALIVENTGFEISGFLFSAIIDKLIPDRRFHIYLLTNDTSKSFLVNKTFHNIYTVPYSDLSLLENLSENVCQLSPVEKEAFYDTFEKIFITEKIKTFILDYSHLILENITEPSTWFNEYYDLVKLITGIEKTVIKLFLDTQQLIFTSIKDFRLHNILHYEITKNIDNYIILMPETCYDVDNSEEFIKYNIESFGQKIGEIIFVFNKAIFNNDSVESILRFLLNPLKFFSWYNSYSFIKNKATSGLNSAKMFQNIFKKIENVMPKNNNIIVSAEKTSYFTIKHRDSLYYFVSTATNEINTLLNVYINNFISVSNPSFAELISAVNSFIHSNILYLYPLPLGLLKITENSVFFSATEGILAFYEDEDTKKILETNMQYFGTYDTITEEIIELPFGANVKIKLCPDAFFLTLKDREKLIKGFLKV